MKQTIDLLNQLKGNGALLGQHCGYAASASQRHYDLFVGALEEQTGRAPSLIGLNWGRDSTAPEILDSIPLLVEWNQRGGLIMVDFHNLPSPWTGERANRIPDGASLRDLINPALDISCTWDEMVGRVHVGLSALNEIGIEVLFRPLPEMTFQEAKWWDVGTYSEYRAGKNIEPFKELWRNLHDRFSDLHNLAWVYSAANTERREWPVLLNAMYPGPNYVDAVGLSCYGNPPVILGNGYKRLLALNKPIGLWETGSVSRDGTFPGTEVIDAIQQRCPGVIAMHWWHSYGPPGDRTLCAIIDHAEPAETMAHPWAITLDKLPANGCPDHSAQVEEMRRMGKEMIDCGDAQIERGDRLIELADMIATDRNILSRF